MHWIPRLRLAVARRPWIHWLIVCAVAALVATVVIGAVADARRERASWGSTARVLVATRALDAGDVVRGAAELRELPLAMVPATAVRSPTTARTVVRQVAAGAVIVDLDVAAASGPLALLPDGWLAVTVAAANQFGSGQVGSGQFGNGQFGNGASGDVDTTASLFTVGSAAAVLADGRLVAEDAIIIAVGADVLVVAVPADVAAAVGDAANRRVAVVALSANR
jgi:hypothetical protein